MLRSGSVRRALAATAAAGIAAGIATLPTTAQATVPGGFFAGVAANANYTGTTSGAQCQNSTGSSYQNQQSTDQPVTAGTHHASSQMTATFTDTSDSTDTVTVAARAASTLVVANHGPDLKALSMTTVGSLNISRSLGSASSCTANAQAFGGLEIAFTEHAAGWLTVTRTSAQRHAVSIFDLVNETTGKGVTGELYEGAGSHATERVFLTPGTYVVPEAENGIESGGYFFFGRNAGRTQTATRSVSLSLSFTKAGSAFGSASGAAKRYVRFPASLNCASGEAHLQWSGAASNAASGVFLVNGQQKGSTTSPSAGQWVRLQGIPSAHQARITARVMMKSGRTLTASRLYSACQH